MTEHHQFANFIWQIADLLRGPYRPPQYERVILPMTVLRRFDCVLAPTKPRVLLAYEKLKEQLDQPDLDAQLNSIAGQPFYNHSPFDFETLKSDPKHIDRNLVHYIESFSENVRKIFDQFDFTTEIERMHEANILYIIITQFCYINLHIDVIDNIEMGNIFQNLIRRFNEAVNETAGDYFTPREVIRLMVSLVFEPDEDVLNHSETTRTLLDPACGTGGMLAEAQDYLRKKYPQVHLSVFGQDFNPRAYAIAASDFLIKGSEKGDIRFGDTLINDQFPGETFDYLLANPPFGVDWKKQQKEIRREYHQQGMNGRFGAGLPRVSDGSFLFLQHMISKCKSYSPGSTENLGSRLAIVFNGSPLFTGGAGSGESEIRKWIIENDWLEAIVALPEQMFYNTGIGTYVWIVTNRKSNHRKGHIQLIDARDRCLAMRRNLGNKRCFMNDEHIAAVVHDYCQCTNTATSKIFGNDDFGYNHVPIERPLRLLYQMNVERKSLFLDTMPHLLDDIQAIDRKLGRTPRTDWSEFDTLMKELLEQRNSRWRASEYKLFREVFTDREPDAEPVILKERKARGNVDERVWGWFPCPHRAIERMYEPDIQLRDFENIQLKTNIVHYFRQRVEPYVPDAWADREKIRSAYEINFNRHFYEYIHPRSLTDIDFDLKQVRENIIRLLDQVVG